MQTSIFYAQGKTGDDMAYGALGDLLRSVEERAQVRALGERYPALSSGGDT